MNLNYIERAVDSTWRMINARAALQAIMKADYPKVVKGWVDAIQEKRLKTGKSPLELLCDMAENEKNQLFLLMLLAATLEIIEEDARCDGAL